MAWVIVEALEDLRLQLNTIAPNRDKSSDGGVGDTSHAAGRSSHNPDRTGSPEYADGDSRDEIRARDFDKDLRHPTITARMVVRHLVEGARSGRFWWIRYIIFDGVIYHKDYGFAARAYTGANKHDHHFHVNNDFTQAADNYGSANYHLEELLPLSPKEWDEMATQAQIEDAVEIAVRKVLNESHRMQPNVVATRLEAAGWDEMSDRAVLGRLFEGMLGLGSALSAFIDYEKAEDTGERSSDAVRDAALARLEAATARIEGALKPPPVTNR